MVIAVNVSICRRLIGDTSPMRRSRSPTVTIIWKPGLTERGDSYFIFDRENMEFKETDFQDLSMDELSLNFDFGNSKNMAETKDGHSTETKNIHTQVTIQSEMKRWRPSQLLVKWLTPYFK